MTEFIQMGKPSEPTDPIGSAVGTSRRPRMSQYEIAWMLGCCARIPAVLLAARGPLVTTLFEASEARFVLLWRAITSACDDNRGSLPGDTKTAKEIVALKCAGEIASDQSRMFYSPSVEHGVMGEGGLLDELFAMPISPEVEGQGLTLVSRFIIERSISDPFRRAMAGIGPQDTMSDPAAVIAAIEKHTREVAGIGVDPGTAAVRDDDELLPPGPKLYTTKLGWLDELLGGGQARQECYALLGPTSGGKSAISVQISVEGAELQSSLAAELGPDVAGHWYFFTYEMNEKYQLRPRIHQYGARIHYDTMKAFAANERPLSTSEHPETLNEYERDPYVNSPGNEIMGERERLIAFKKRMSGPNCRLHVVDYSGTHAGHGLGGVDEIAGYLRKEMARGRRPVGLIVDYAGICVQRMIASRKLRPDAEYPLLSSFVDAVRSQVCVPMDCTAWVLHQLHGDAAKRPPGAKVHHSDARGCRNFADNSDFGIQLSTYNKASGLLTVHCTKHRRAPGREDGTIVRFRGEYGAFLSPDQEYEIDPVSRQIVVKGYSDMLQPRAQNRSRRGPVNPTDGLN